MHSFYERADGSVVDIYLDVAPRDGGDNYTNDKDDDDDGDNQTSASGRRGPILDAEIVSKKQ